MIKISITRLVEVDVEVFSCPFCGHERVELRNPIDCDDIFAVYCEECRTYGPRRATQLGAVADWNKRHVDITP